MEKVLEIRKTVLGIILLLGLCLSTFSQRRLEYKQTDDFIYMMKVDAVKNKLIHSSDPLLLPWLPKYQFGWRIQDRNYFDLFFKHIDPSHSPLSIDFYEYIVLSIIKFDQYVWEIDVNEITYGAEENTVTIQYNARKKGEELSHFQPTTHIIFVKKNKQMRRIPSSHLAYQVIEKNYSQQPDPLLDQEDIKLFPEAYTDKKFFSYSDIPIQLVDLLFYFGTDSTSKSFPFSSWDDELVENLWDEGISEKSDLESISSNRGVIKDDPSEDASLNHSGISAKSDEHLQQLLLIREAFEEQQKRVQQLYDHLEEIEHIDVSRKK